MHETETKQKTEQFVNHHNKESKSSWDSILLLTVPIFVLTAVAVLLSIVL